MNENAIALQIAFDRLSKKYSPVSGDNEHSQYLIDQTIATAKANAKILNCDLAYKVVYFQVSGIDEIILISLNDLVEFSKNHISKIRRKSLRNEAFVD